MTKMEKIEKEIIDLVRRKKAIFISDIARKFGIHSNTARDLVKMMKNDLAVEDKGVAKLVTLKENEN